jgi:flagellar hook assembly protein FlgD
MSAVDDGGDGSGAVVAPGVLRIHPNPSGSGASIAFVLETPQSVELAVYDAAGRLVATVASGELPAGSQEQTWDGTTASGEQAAAGVYFVRLKAAGKELTAKSVVVR